MAASEATRAPAVHDNGAGVDSRARRLITETKAAFKTTEFWAMLGLIVALLMSEAVIEGGDDGTDRVLVRPVRGPGSGHPPRCTGTSTLATGGLSPLTGWLFDESGGSRTSVTRGRSG